MSHTIKQRVDIGMELLSAVSTVVKYTEINKF